MSISDYETIKKLSETPSFTVHKVRSTATLKSYALKRVDLSSATDSAKESYFTEAQLLASANSAHLICYEQVFYESPTTLCIIMEYAKGPTLREKIITHKKNNTFFTEPEVWDLLRQIALGLKALHDLSLTHHNLTSSNIFFTKNHQLKIGGFNLAKVVRVSPFSELAQYSSPEVWKKRVYYSKCDIWSFGCVLYEICVLSLPFQSSNARRLVKTILKCKYPPIPGQYSSELTELIGKMLSVDSGARPSCKKILLSPWIRSNCRPLICVSVPSDNNGRIKFDESSEDITKSPSCNPFKYLSCSEQEMSSRSPEPFSKSSGIMFDTPICKEIIEEKMKLLKRKYKKPGNPGYLVPKLKHN